MKRGISRFLPKGFAVTISLVLGAEEGHDQIATSPDRDATVALADALDRVALQGAIFLHGRYTENWAYLSIPGKDATAMFAPDGGQVVLFHVVAEGRCWVQVEGGQKHWADAGDVIVLPYGDQHAMGGTADAELVEMRRLVAAPPWDEMPYIQHGEGGEPTHVICGYLTCNDPLFDRTLRAFPPAFVVRPEGAAKAWVQSSIEYATGQIVKVADDRFEAPTTIPRLLLAEVLKLHLRSAPATELGFLSALRDPVLAPALARIHQHPGTKWTVCDLAEAAHVSESLLDDRFRTVLGMPPIRYLTTWRMHVAQDLLSTTDLSVFAIARQVGYESEEAFSRAFKRKHGIAPSVWRRG